MTTPRKTSNPSGTARKERVRADRQKELQPRATGGNGGSPAAPVMQQFVKTKTERNGRR